MYLGQGDALSPMTFLPKATRLWTNSKVMGQPWRTLEVVGGVQSRFQRAHGARIDVSSRRKEWSRVEVCGSRGSG